MVVLTQDQNALSGVAPLLRAISFVGDGASTAYVNVSPTGQKIRVKRMDMIYTGGDQDMAGAEVALFTPLTPNGIPMMFAKWNGPNTSSIDITLVNHRTGCLDLDGSCYWGINLVPDLPLSQLFFVYAYEVLQ